MSRGTTSADGHGRPRRDGIPALTRPWDLLLRLRWVAWPVVMVLLPSHIGTMLDGAALVGAGLRSLLDLARAYVDKRPGAVEPIAGSDARHRLPARDPSPQCLGCDWDTLSELQRRIAQMIAQSMTDRQIAGRVFLSHHTINYHVRIIYRRLGINSRVQLTAVALAHAAHHGTSGDQAAGGEPPPA
jgi:DNA-binding CsgD family transcriptional regulator